jgi:hypothetical protein
MKRYLKHLASLLLVLFACYSWISCSSDDDNDDNEISYALEGQWVGEDLTYSYAMVVICNGSDMKCGLYQDDDDLTELGFFVGTYNYYPAQQKLIALWDNGNSDEFIITNVMTNSFKLSFSDLTFNMQRYTNSSGTGTGSGSTNTQAYAPVSLAGHNLWLANSSLYFKIFFNDDNTTSSESRSSLGDVISATYTRTGNNTAALSVTYRSLSGKSTSTTNFSLIFTSAQGGTGSRDDITYVTNDWKFTVDKY